MEQLNALQALILGIIQGLTEFLPVSSSGHLILARQVLHFPEPGKVFDILMHSGTLIALIIYFWKDLTGILGNFFKSALRGKFYGNTETNLFWFLIVSTIPGGLFGFLFEDRLEQINNVYLISGLLIVFGILLLISDRRGRKELAVQNLTLRDALIVGMAQALALFPGVSRSGISMTAALFLGYTREESARYSFLISVPLIGGISIYGLVKILGLVQDKGTLFIFALGLLASIISGLLCIKFLLEYLKKGTFLGFVIYRVLVGALLIFLGLWGIIR